MSDWIASPLADLVLLAVVVAGCIVWIVRSHRKGDA